MGKYRKSKLKNIVKYNLLGLFVPLNNIKVDKKTKCPQHDRKNQLRSPISEEGGRKPNVLNRIDKIS